MNKIIDNKICWLSYSCSSIFKCDHNILIMQTQQIVLAILLVTFAQALLVHEQTTGFACCPETYIFN